MIADMRSLLKWQTVHSYVRQSGTIVDGYQQLVYTSGTFLGFNVPYSTHDFLNTDYNFSIKGNQILITEEDLEVNDEIDNLWKILEEVEVASLVGLNYYNLKNLI